MAINNQTYPQEEQSADLRHASDLVDAMFNYVSGLISINQGSPEEDEPRINRVELECLLQPLHNNLAAIQQDLCSLVFADLCQQHIPPTNPSARAAHPS